MESIKRGWSSVNRTFREKFSTQPQEEDYFSQSWFDTLIGGEDQSCFSYFQIPFKVRMIIVVMLVFLGVISLIMSFTFVLLPMKFAKLFTVGNLLILLSTFFIRSITSQIKSLINDIPKAIAFIVYLLSIILTLVAALYFKSILLTLPCIVIEIVALIWYLFSYIPYGNSMLSGLIGMCFRGVSN
ncbi:Vesicle transport protein [Entamoeba marina]